MKKTTKCQGFRTTTISVAILLLNLIAIPAFSAVTLTPSQLTFDCNSITPMSINVESITPLKVSTSPQILTTEPELFVPSQKMLNKAKIESEISASGLSDVMITINLDSPKNTAKTRHGRIQNAQQQMHGELTRLNAKTKRMFENIPVIYAEINAETLEFLKTNTLAVSVEAVLPIEIHTSQGIPLMDADVYRPIFDGTGVAVAILDSGIDYTHPALGNGTFPNSKVIGGYDFGSNDSDPMAVGSSHGTNCAGLSSGDEITYSDYIGGVAPGSKLYALKIMPDNSGSTTTANIVSAIDWCISHQFDDPNNPLLVINMSVGGGQYTSTCDSASSALTNAVNTATATGIAVLSSSGNDGYCNAMGLPACVSNVISVGAVWDASLGTLGFCLSDDSCVGTVSASCSSPNSKILYSSTSADVVAGYSNSSSLTDVLAPCHYAYTTDIKGVTGSSVGDYFGAFGGTSAACAYASGAVAALQSAAIDTINRFLTPDEVRQLFILYGEPVTDTKNNITTPRISVAEAIEHLETFNGQTIDIYNSSNFSTTIESITAPQWVTVSPQAPISIPGKQTATLYVSGDCDQCDYQPLSGDIIIAGTGFPNSSFSETAGATLNCPLCLLSGNLNGGCEVDLLDFSILAACWLSSDSLCETANIDGTLPVDEPDLLIMASEWLEGK